MQFLLLGLLGMIFLSKKNKEIELAVTSSKSGEITKIFLENIPFIPSPNFARKNNRNIDKIVIHITQGSFASAIGWFKMKTSSVSSHFLVSQAGEVVQMVKIKDIAWHAKPWNTRSIGIEHEGFFNYHGKNTNFTEKQYKASAEIVRELAFKYNIPLDRNHIIGHREVPGVTKTCPGYNWNWDYYMNLLRVNI